MRNLLFIPLFVSLASVLQAQLPKSNVFLFDIKMLNDTSIQFSKPRYLTYFNANGYNNQPAFFSEKELCLAVQSPGENQTELYLFDLEKKTKTRMTQTPEGEYSPALMPDPFRFSALRQEISREDTAQRIWEFPVDRLNDGRPVFKYINNVGYYTWITNSKVAIFKITNPNELAIADVYTDKVTTVATNVGRCFRISPTTRNLVFVRKSNFDNWKLVERKNPWSDSDNTITEIAETVPDSEDFAILSNGSFVMGKGSRLFLLNPKAKDKKWKEIANFRLYNMENITRLAISPDGTKLAIVAN